MHISGSDHTASILYSSPQDSAPDIAILQLSRPTNSGQRHLETFLKDSKMLDQVEQGNDVYALAHGGCRAGPLVTRGVVSSVVHSGTQVVMLHTTCSVHNGMSGGVVWWAGHPIGLIVCNTR